MELLDDHEADEAYLQALPGKKYLIYFPDSGAIRQNLSEHAAPFLIKWIQIRT